MAVMQLQEHWLLLKRNMECGKDRISSQEQMDTFCIVAKKFSIFGLYNNTSHLFRSR